MVQKTLFLGCWPMDYKNRLTDLDPLLGKNWHIKLKQDDRFFYITSTEIALEMPS